MRSTYNECRDFNKFLAEGNRKIQNHRSGNMVRNRCGSCFLLSERDISRSKKYCSLGGFETKNFYTCDEFK